MDRVGRAPPPVGEQTSAKGIEEDEIEHVERIREDKENYNLTTL